MDRAAEIDPDFRDLGAKNGNYSVMFLGASYSEIDDISEPLLRGLTVAHQLSDGEDTLIVVFVREGISDLVLFLCDAPLYESFASGGVTQTELLEAVIVRSTE